MLDELRRPPRIRPGDRVAAVTLGWGGPSEFRARYEAGKRQLEEALDVEVVEMPHTLADADWLADHPEARADDLHRALADPDVHALVSTIGGDDGIRVLPHLDLGLIAEHPKVLLGYSDSTTIQMAFLQAGVVSFYGPAIMAGFGENAGLHDYLVRGVRSALVDPAPDTPWPPNVDGWTAEQPDWGDPSTQSVPRTLTPSDGWQWHGGPAREGPAVAACMEVLDWLRGTPWWPDLDGAVLLLETSEEQPPPEVVTRFVRSLAAMGDLQRLAGMVLGRPGGEHLPVAEHDRYVDALLGAVRHEAGLSDLPIVTGVDFGHTDPMWTIPQGVPLSIDTEAMTLTFLAPGVR